MKIFICFFVSALVACLLIEANAERKIVKEVTGENCTLQTHYDDGSFSTKACAPWRCKSREDTIGHKAKDFSKPYPECCDGPICKE
ncbi:uncharacterized protein LOC141534227 [Cotesia typhae]